MSELVIRKMMPEDLVQVCQIEKDNFSLPWSEKSFLESMERDDTVFLVALEDDEVAGYLGCYCICGTGEITNVAVKYNHRRKGIGGKLLEKLYQEGIYLGLCDAVAQALDNPTETWDASESAPLGTPEEEAEAPAEEPG